MQVYSVMMLWGVLSHLSHDPLTCFPSSTCVQAVRLSDGKHFLFFPPTPDPDAQPATGKAAGQTRMVLRVSTQVRRVRTCRHRSCACTLPRVAARFCRLGQLVKLPSQACLYPHPPTSTRTIYTCCLLLSE